MSKSQNGWPVIYPGGTTADWPRLRAVKVPGVKVPIPLRDGCAAFVLAHYALWHHEKIENLNNRVSDEWGYAFRAVREGVSFSNHASGTAEDLNATLHPHKKWRTFKPSKRRRIRRRLRFFFKGYLRSGIDYTKTPDDMHIEIVGTLPQVNRLAIRLMRTPRGKRILAANPGLKAAILK